MSSEAAVAVALVGAAVLAAEAALSVRAGEARSIAMEGVSRALLAKLEVRGRSLATAGVSMDSAPAMLL